MLILAIEDERKLNIRFSPPLISTARPMVKLSNNSLIDAFNFTRFSTYYFSFSPELICRYSFFHNPTICFYYSSSINFIEIEHHFDQITNVSVRLPLPIRKRLWLILNSCRSSHSYHLSYCSIHSMFQSITM